MLKVTLITAEGKTICQCFDAEYHTLFRCRVPDTMQLRLYKTAPAETMESLLLSGQIDDDMTSSELPRDLRDKLEPGALVTHLYVPTSFALQITPCVKKESADTWAIYSREKNAWFDRFASVFIPARIADCEYDSQDTVRKAKRELEIHYIGLEIFKSGETP